MVDLRCLVLLYVHQFQRYRKIHSSNIGSGEGVNSAHLIALQKTKTTLNSNMPLLLVVASEQRDWAVGLMKSTV